jgi:hypothetical protein
MNNVQHKSERRNASQKKALKIRERGYMALMVQLLLITLKEKHITLVLAACYSPCLVKQVAKKEQNVYLQWCDL